MNRVPRLATVAIVALFGLGQPAQFHAYPSVYPTGTTIYMPDKAWNGYMIHDTPDSQGAVLIDMNGNVLRHWTDLTAVPSPFRILPGGHVVGGDVPREPYQEGIVLVQRDWDGNEVWRWDRTERVQTEDAETLWGSRQHHDWQREGNPVGYYAPGLDPQTKGGKTLILAHRNVTVPDISPRRLEDDLILEVSWDGEILWEWLASDHIDEFGLTEDARNAIHRSVGWNEKRQSADWAHINSVSYVGPNKWYDAGDERFHPQNVMFSSRETNVIGIIDRSGAIVWRMGPDYRQSEALEELGQIIGQHKPHIIPKGLPGEGNLLVFDNGGAAGYGFANPAAPNGRNSVRRDSSRLLEINPVTFEKVWEYAIPGTQRFKFYSSYVSNAQRLPNGNTMINEGMIGRVFELTKEKEIVWEYVTPIFGVKEPVTQRLYRAYRVPYEWIPQLEKPEERPVVPPVLSEFRIAPQ